MAVRNEGKVEMTIDVEELVELSLSEARSAIEGYGSWEPLVHIFHPKGVESILIRGLGADPRQKDQLANRINSRMKELNGILVIMVTDCWVGKGIPENSMTGSLQTPYLRQAEALMVAVWGPDGVTTCGMQMYRHCSNGKVQFDKLEWTEQSNESVCRFAPNYMGDRNNEYGTLADSKKTLIH